MEEFNSKQAQSKHTQIGERRRRSLYIYLSAPHLIEPGMLHALELNVQSPLWRISEW